jgi:hypothetical protein
MINISEEFANYDYTFNRTLSSIIELPYNRSDIELGVNELVNSHNFNTSLDNLQSNLMYLYSISKFANPDLPRQYNGWVGTGPSSVGISLNVVIYSINLVSVVKFDDAGDVIPYTIPYFYFKNSNNINYNFIFSYNETVNPDTTYLPTGVNYEISLSSGEFQSDATAITEVARILNSIGLTAVYTTPDSVNQLEITTSSSGGIFFANKNPATYQHILGTNCKVTVTQGGTSSEFNIFTTTNSTILPNPSNYDQLMCTAVSPASLSGFNNVFTCSETRIQSLSANVNSSGSSNFKFIGYTDTYGTNNQLNFLKINAAAIYENSLYISDETRNNVVRLNINGFINSDKDSQRFNKFFETKIIGGEGVVRSNYSFNQPKIIQFYNEKLYVFDQGNLTIKVYDKELNYISNIRKAAFIRNNIPASVKIHNDNFYWLTPAGVLYILDLNLNLIDTHVLFNKNNVEEFLDLFISTINNNFYVITKSNIYKYFTNSKIIIGEFNLSSNNIIATDLKFITNFNVNGKDLIYVYSSKNGRGMFLSFLEDDHFLNLLSDYNFNIFSTDELHIQKNEFTSSFVYNKACLKMLGNLTQFINFIYKKIKCNKNKNGIYTFNGITYFNTAELDVATFTPDLNNFIGVNEIFSSAVINRLLNKLYDLQLDIVDMLNVEIILPAKQTSYLSKQLQGLMLDTFPDNPNSYILLEVNDNPLIQNVLIQEYAVMQN